jgi:hypothetical protein
MSLLSRLFQSKAQKAVDALQESLDRRLLAIEGGLKLFKQATESFVPGDEQAFKVAQAKHEYFTTALLDDLAFAENRIKVMRRDLGYNRGRPQPGFASEVTAVEEIIEATDNNIARLVKATQTMLDLAGLS